MEMRESAGVVGNNPSLNILNIEVTSNLGETILQAALSDGRFS
jgi:hypothetical protein